MTDRGRPGPVVFLVVLAGFVLLCGLGVWQVQRLKWKTALLARIAALQTAPPEPLEAVLRRAPDGVDLSFVRVQGDCPTLEQTATLRLQSLKAGEIGFRLITACPVSVGPYRSLLVDRGYASAAQAQGPAPAAAPLAAPVVGVLRRPDAATFVTPKNQPAQNLWYWRDIPAMAAALRAERPAPVVLMLERPAPARGWPAPEPLPPAIPNNHLGYAITWFGLAAALAGVYLAMLLRKRPSR